MADSRREFLPFDLEVANEFSDEGGLLAPCQRQRMRARRGRVISKSTVLVAGAFVVFSVAFVAWGSHHLAGWDAKGVSIMADSNQRVAGTKGRIEVKEGCFTITDAKECCKHFDGRTWMYDGEPCVPAKPGTTFSNGRVCQPQCWVKGKCTWKEEIAGKMDGGHWHDSDPDMASEGVCELAEEGDEDISAKKGEGAAGGDGANTDKGAAGADGADTDKEAAGGGKVNTDKGAAGGGDANTDEAAAGGDGARGEGAAGGDGTNADEGSAQHERAAGGVGAGEVAAPAGTDGADKDGTGAGNNGAEEGKEGTKASSDTSEAAQAAADSDEAASKGDKGEGDEGGGVAGFFPQVPKAKTHKVWETCWIEETTYEPLDMEGTEPTSASSALECQKKCLNNEHCLHFSFWEIGKDCHLQDWRATAQPTRIGFVAGPRVCGGNLPESDYTDLGNETIFPKAYSCWVIARDYAPKIGIVELTESKSARQAAVKCQNACAENPDCGHFMLTFPARTCTMAFHNATSSPVAAHQVAGPPRCQPQP